VSPIEERILARAQDKTNMNAFSLIEAGEYTGSKDEQPSGETQARVPGTEDPRPRRACLTRPALAANEPAGGEKRKFIEEILAADLEAAGGGRGRGGHGESLVEDDEALNELMARDEAEFKRLQARGAVWEERGEGATTHAPSAVAGYGQGAGCDRS